MPRLFACLIGLSSLIGPAFAHAADPPKFEFKEGDRVVLIGDALIERDQKYGYLETLLTLQNPDKTITFRNLGWSGDTVFGEARARFGTPADGFQHLKEHVLALKPTVLIIGYGMTDSFAGEAGLPRFVSGLNTLLDALAEIQARIILLSPIAHEDLGRPLPDPAGHNKDLKLYIEAIRDVAGKRGARFINLFHPDRPMPWHWTDDGIHLTEFGSMQFAREVHEGLTSARLSSFFWYVRSSQCPLIFGDESRITKDGDARAPETEVLERGLPLDALASFLPGIPGPPWDLYSPLHGTTTPTATRSELVVFGLPKGQYQLRVDGKVTVEADHPGGKALLLGLPLGPEVGQVERLRKAINEKNTLYFYRWRPQNETYLFGFRKHEQGQNAREIPLFDPLVDEKEKEIARLRVPVPHVYELVRASGEEK